MVKKNGFTGRVKVSVALIHLKTMRLRPCTVSSTIAKITAFPVAGTIIEATFARSIDAAG